MVKVRGRILSTKILFLASFILVVFVIVSSYLLVLLMGYGFVFFTPGGTTLSTQFFPAYFLVFFIVGFYFPVQSGAAFSFVWIVYVLSFGAAWMWRESFHKVTVESPFRPMKSIFNNFLFIMPLISSMVLAAATAIISIQDFFGVPTGQVVFPSAFSQQNIFLELAWGPVVEELGFRLIPIGLCMIFYVLLSGKNAPGRSLRLLITAGLNPDEAKRIAGLRNVREDGIMRGLNVGEWTLVLVTTFVFAIAHVISPIGWEIGKVSSVFVQGFAFALAYLAYGFEAPILLHWFFNYYSFFFDQGIIKTFFPTADPILSVVELVMLALGIAGWLAFVIIGLKKLLKPSASKHDIPTTPRMPPPIPSS
jgi:hypothetical protein